VNLDPIMALVSVVGDIIVLCLLLRGKAWHTLPVFCFWVLSNMATDSISAYMMLGRPQATYPGYFLVQLGFDSLLELMVIVELAWSTLRPIRKSLPRATFYVIALLIAIAAAIVWPLVGKTVPAAYGPQSSLQFHLQNTISILRVGFFLVLAAGSQVLSIGWRDRELQIATGLGFFSIVSLIVAVMHTHGSSPDQYHVLDQVQTGSYLCTLSYWVLSFATKEQERKEFSPQMQQLLLQMGGGVRSNRIALTHIPPARTRKKD
jgi:hypothetical protein